MCSSGDYSSVPRSEARQSIRVEDVEPSTLKRGSSSRFGGLLKQASFMSSRTVTEDPPPASPLQQSNDSYQTSSLHRTPSENKAKEKPSLSKLSSFSAMFSSRKLDVDTEENISESLQSGATSTTNIFKSDNVAFFVEENITGTFGVGGIK